MKIQDIGGFALGPIGGAAFGLITVPVIAWIFSPADVGRLNIFQVTLSFCLLIFTLGLDQAYVREYHETMGKAALLQACVIPGLLLLVAGGVFSYFYAREISVLLYDSADPRLYLITYFAVLIAYLSRFLSLILRMQERGLAFSMSQILPKALLLGVIAFLAMFSSDPGLVELLLAHVISLSVVFLAYAWNTKKDWSVSPHIRLSKEQRTGLFRFGFPLVFSGVAYWGLAAGGVLALRNFSDLSELAVYSMAVSFAAAATVFQSIFSTIWTPLVFKWAAGGGDLKRIDEVAQQVLFVVCLIIASCGCFSWIIDYLLPPIYVDVKYLVLCTIVQPLIYSLSVVTSVGIGVARRNMLSLGATLAAMLSNVSLCIAFVPSYGAAGAAIANAISFFVLFVINTEGSARAWREFPRRKIYAFVGSAVGLCVLTVIFAPTLPIHYSYLWGSLIPVVLFLFREQLAQLLALAKNARMAG